MESNLIPCDINMLIDVLIEGHEHMRELQAQLDQTYSAETCKMLATKAKSALSSAIFMARKFQPVCATPTGFDSPPSACGSPKSDASEKAFKEMERREMCKKRKTMPRWSNQVRACSSSFMDGQLDDGHSWRKYGQKDILGANFPRSYYRCTYRHSHGCLATKHIQRSDEDNSLFDITYRGFHTCNHNLQKNQTQSQKDKNLDQNQQLLLLQHLKTGLKVKTEDFNYEDQLQHFSPTFSFPSTPSNNKKIISSASMPENHLMGNYSPNFASTTTSVESNYFFQSSCGVNNYVSGFNLHGLDTEIAEIMSADTSTTNSPIVSNDFTVDGIEFEIDFPFGLP